MDYQHVLECGIAVMISHFSMWCVNQLMTGNCRKQTPKEVVTNVGKEILKEGVEEIKQVRVKDTRDEGVIPQSTTPSNL